METKWTKKRMDKLKKKMMRWARKNDNYIKILRAKTEFDFGELVAKCAMYLDLDLNDEMETTFIYCGLLKIQQESSSKNR